MKSPVKKKVVRKLDKDSRLSDVLINSTAGSIHEGKVVNSLIDYLKDLNFSRQYPLFHSMINKIFKEQLDNDDFVKWLASRLGIRPSKFSISLQCWNEKQFVECRGRSRLSLEKQQIVYDTWLNNSINSTDARNGRNVIRSSKRKYLEMYQGLENKDIVMEEKVNKRGQKYFHVNKMIVTCTSRNIQKQLADKGIIVSLGKVLSLRPFFVMLASEKELSLCLCKLCLNSRMLYDHLLAKCKKDGDSMSESLTEFFMSSCECPKSINGYWSWKCVTLKCDSCRFSPFPNVKCQSSKESTKVYQFETTKTPYETTDKEHQEHTIER